MLLAAPADTLSGSNSPPSGLSRISSSPARHFWYYFFHFWPLVQTLGCDPTVVSPWSSSMPPSLGRDWIAPPPPRSVTSQEHQNSHLFSDIVLLFFDFLVTGGMYDNQTCWTKMFRKSYCTFCDCRLLSYSSCNSEQHWLVCELVAAIKIHRSFKTS